MSEIYYPRHASKAYEPLHAHQAAVRRIVCNELEKVQILDEKEKQTLAACYLQHNTVDSTAYKLQMDPNTVRMWYYRLSMAQLRACFDNYRNQEKS